MTTELQNKVWSILPKEFKEEVKECYQYARKNNESDLQRGASDTVEHFFGLHNLTSDEEPHVSRKQIDALQSEIFEAIMDAHDADDWQDAAHLALSLSTAPTHSASKKSSK